MKKLINKKIIFIFACAVVLTGCSNLQKKQISSIEELETEGTTSALKSNTQEETNIPNTLNGVDKDMVECYIDDSHFYDEKDGVDFVYTQGVQNENYHITILDAWCADTLAECGEYFLENPSDIPEVKKYVTEQHKVKDEDITYLCVKIQLTNKESIETEFCIKSLIPHVRIADDRLVEYGLADAYIKYPLLYTEFWYDSMKKKSGNSYYFFDMQPGEMTDAITVVYLVEKGKELEDLYLGLNLGTPKNNAKFRCNFPPDDEDTKFLKINLRGVNEE